jgi:hypothetical protein
MIETSRSFVEYSLQQQQVIYFIHDLTPSQDDSRRARLFVGRTSSSSRSSPGNMNAVVAVAAVVVAAAATAAVIVDLDENLDLAVTAGIVVVGVGIVALHGLGNLIALNLRKNGVAAFDGAEEVERVPQDGAQSRTGGEVPRTGGGKLMTGEVVELVTRLFGAGYGEAHSAFAEPSPAGNAVTLPAGLREEAGAHSASGVVKGVDEPEPFSTVFVVVFYLQHESRLVLGDFPSAQAALAGARSGLGVEGAAVVRGHGQCWVQRGWRREPTPACSA